MDRQTFPHFANCGMGGSEEGTGDRKAPTPEFLPLLVLHV